MIKYIPDTDTVKLGFAPTMRAADNPLDIMEAWSRGSKVQRFIVRFMNGDDLSFSVQDLLKTYDRLVTGEDSLEDFDYTSLDELPARATLATCAKTLLAAGLIQADPDTYNNWGRLYYVVLAARRSFPRG